MLIKPTFSAANTPGAAVQASQRKTLANGIFIRFFRIAARPFVSSSSFHRVKLDREVSYLRLHDFFVIAIAHFYRVSVGASFEHDIVLVGEVLVDVSRQAIKIPKRRHRPDGGVGEE